ncbi:MAG: hypothetical protein H0S85_16825 [Desulfovibrionaceae bacterium]|jgi:hypothetical protein|nr:hypothetical protein [Desulfovibrionaceae bacterium]
MRNFAIILLLLAAPGLASAQDLVAKWRYGNGSTTTLYAKDDTHIRMDTGPDSVMLLSGDKVYMLTRDDGQWQAVDMDQMGALASSWGGGSGKGAATYTAGYEKTGRTEKIAGYTGAVYKVTVRQNDKIVSQGEAVLCTHPDVLRMNRAWAALSSRMISSMGQQEAKSLEKLLADSQNSGHGGLLRYDQDMVLTSLTTKNYAAGHYQLPPNVQMQSMDDAAAGGWTPPEQQQDGSDGDSGSGSATLKQDAKDVGQAAKDEAKDTTIDEVRQGVREVFKGLFN